MKKLHLKYNCFFAVVLTLTIFLFIGCSKETKKYDTKYIKYKGITLERLYDVYSRNTYAEKNQDRLAEYLQSVYNYKGDISQEALLETYVVGFHVKDETGIAEYYGFVLQPCEYSKDYKNFESYPIHRQLSSVWNSKKDQKVLSAYFLIDDLISIGYFSKNSYNQKNLCFFEIVKTEDMAYNIYVKSNDIVYTAEEINAVMDAYEALR